MLYGFLLYIYQFMKIEHTSSLATNTAGTNQMCPITMCPIDNDTFCIYIYTQVLVI